MNPGARAVGRLASSESGDLLQLSPFSFKGLLFVIMCLCVGTCVRHPRSGLSVLLGLELGPSEERYTRPSPLSSSPTQAS